MENHLDFIKNRKTVRLLADTEVDLKIIKEIIEAAKYAPSMHNIQPWRFIVLNDPEVIKEFSSKAFSGIYRFTRWAAKAPVIIAIFAELDVIANRLGKQIQGTHYYLIDVGIAGEHFVLQAQELGLGTCWIGWFDERAVKSILKVPRDRRVDVLISVGYCDRKKLGRPHKRDSMEEIAAFNSY